MTEQPSTLAAALVELQRNLPHVGKAETARVETAKGSFSYAYAGLSAVTEAILPRLAELGLAWVCRPTVADGRPVLAYALIHVNGERETGEMPLLMPANPTPQQVGSSISYARRYALLAVTGVAPAGDDDDAAAASAKPATARKAPTRRASTPTEASTQDEPTEIEIERRRRAMFATLKNHGYTDTDPEVTKRLQLNFIRSALGREIQSRKELTAVDVDAVLTALREGLTDDHSETPA